MRVGSALKRKELGRCSHGLSKNVRDGCVLGINSLHERGAEVAAKIGLGDSRLGGRTMVAYSAYWLLSK